MKLFIILSLSLMSLQAHAKKDYVGSQKCFSCHEDQYNDFVVSGHPYKLTKAKIAKNRPLPLPKGYDWSDISYVIGGVYKKARYIDGKG